MNTISNAYGFQLANAAALAKAANLVYADWESVDTEVKVAGYKQFKYFDKAHTQAFVAANDKNIIVSFRGTEADKMEDILTDLKVSFVDTKFGQVHSGFYEAVNIIIEEVCETVAAFRTNNQNLWVTGHSLGAALATLGTAFLQDAKLHVNGLYTFGQPRVGDEQFAEKFNMRFKSRAFRVVNNCDIVTRVPMRSIGYSHIGTHIYLDNEGDMHIDEELSWWFGFTDRVKGRVETFKNKGIDDVADHSMDLYNNILNKNLKAQPIA
jgi:triacylglycerol lipase